MAIDLTTDRGKVRLLISDVMEVDFLFTDEEIDAFLSMEGAVLLAAARALEVIASNENQVQKRITILDLKTDGPAVSKELRELAASWREQWEATDEDDDYVGFEIAEQVVDTFTHRDRLLNDLLRSAL